MRNSQAALGYALASQDNQTALVEVPEWGSAGQPAQVRIRKIGLFLRWHIRSLAARGRRQNLRARCCIYFLSDAEGHALLRSADLAALSQKSGTALDRVFSAGLKLNDLGY